jgi:hypothetical protein
VCAPGCGDCFFNNIEKKDLSKSQFEIMIISMVVSKSPPTPSGTWLSNRRMK